jgi:hypothetical protein
MEKYRMRKAAWVWVTASAASLACGDAETTDTRGYTKAPLEQPGVMIKAEANSGMDSLGTPTLPRDTLIAPEPATTSKD